MVIGSGGSAFVDGGLGALQALGVYDFMDENGEVFPDDELLVTHHIPSISALKLREDKSKILIDVKLLFPCDVTSPLLGPTGAAYIYGPQKGARQEDLQKLDDHVERIVRLVYKQKG